MATQTQELFNRVQSLGREKLLQMSDADFAQIEAAILGEASARLDARCAKPVASFDAGPLYWVTTHTKTENPNWEKQGLVHKGPFPKRSYFVPLFDELLREDRLFIPKSRTMMTSWSACAYATWRAQWCKWECLIQTGSLGKVVELIDYCAQLWRNQTPCLRELHPLTRNGEPLSEEMKFEGGGRVLAIPSGCDKIRLYHPTLAIFDEMAFLPEAEECYNAAHPACQQIIGVSSAAPGFFGNECTR